MKDRIKEFIINAVEMMIGTIAVILMIAAICIGIVIIMNYDKKHSPRYRDTITMWEVYDADSKRMEAAIKLCLENDKLLRQQVDSIFKNINPE